MNIGLVLVNRFVFSSLLFSFIRINYLQKRKKKMNVGLVLVNRFVFFVSLVLFFFSFFKVGSGGLYFLFQEGPVFSF